MAYTSGTISVQYHGYNKVVNGVNRRSQATYYTPPISTTRPNMCMEFSYTLTRSADNDGKLKVSITPKLWRLCAYTSGTSMAQFDSRTGNFGDSWYSYVSKISIKVGNGPWKLCIEKPNGTKRWTSDVTHSTNPDWVKSIAEYNIDWASSDKIPLYIKHSGGCSPYESCSAGDYETEICKVGVPAYNPYTASTAWLNPNDYTKISRLDTGSWSVHYSYNSGSVQNCPITLAIHDYNAKTWGVRWEPVLRRVTGSSDGVWDSYTLKSSPEGFKNGTAYRIKLVSNGGEKLSPDGWDPQTGLPIYTYQEPLIGTGITVAREYQNATQDNSFTISNYNNRAWDDSLEKVFQTHYRIKKGSDAYTGWTNLNNIATWSRTASEMRSLVPKSYDGQAITIQMRRYSPSADWVSANTASKTIYVYYRPRVGIGSSNVSYRLNNSSGTTISKNQIVNNNSALTEIYASWSYDTNSANAGYTQGYRVRLYDKNQAVVKTYYTTSKNIKIPKGDIPKMQNTYIDITPYYKNDTETASNFWYYNGTIEKIPFVHLVTNIPAPTITYPINNADWINRDFRIGFQLPKDPDYGAQSGTYTYENIEIEINNSYIIKMINSDGTTSGSILPNGSYVFSCKSNELTHEKKILVWPNNQTNMPQTNSYSIRVRVKKRYDANSSNSYGWSPWSSKVTVKVTVPTYSVAKGDIIRATHFNTLRSAVDRALKTYNLTWSNIPGAATARTTEILQSQYSYTAMFSKLNEVKTRVNGYAPISSGLEPIKLDDTNNIITSFSPKEEIITDLADDTSKPGRNYMQKLYDNLQYLK